MKKYLLTLTTVTVVSLTGAFSGNVAQANSVSDLESEQTTIQQERGEIKKDLSKAEAEVADVLIDLEETKDKIKQLEKAQEENNLVLDQTEESITEYETEITGLEEDIEVLEESIEKRHDILKERIASYQQNGGNISFLDVLFGSDNFGDMISRVFAVSNITKADKQLAEDLEDDQEKVVVAQEEVEVKLIEQEELKEDLVEMEVVIKGQKDANIENEKTLKQQEKKLKKTVANLEADDEDLSSLQAQVSRQLSEARNPAPVVASNEVSESDSSSEASSNESNSSSNSSNNSSNESSSESPSSSNNSSSESPSSSNNSSSESPSASSNSSSESSSSSSDGDVTTLTKEEPKKEPVKEAPPASTGGSSSAISAAHSQLSVPNRYVLGGKNPGAFDCSGFVSWAYGQSGKSIPSSTRSLRGTGTKISYSQAQAGDLLFFTNPGGQVDGHVAIYLGNGKFIGSQTSTGVAIVNLNTNSYWNSAFKGHVRRIN